MMDKISDTAPNRNLELAQKVGAVVIQFSRLDITVSEIVLYLEGRYEGDLERAVEYSTHKHVGLRLTEATKLVKKLDPNTYSSKALRMWCRDARAVVEERNDVIHGLWISEDGAFTGVSRRRKNDSSSHFVPFDPEILERLVQRISKLALDVPSMLADNSLGNRLAAKGFWRLPENPESVQRIAENLYLNESAESTLDPLAATGPADEQSKD